MVETKSLEKLKELLEEKKGKKSFEKMSSLNEVEKIVEKMKKNYVKRGISPGEKEGKLKELKKVMEKEPELRIENPKALLGHPNSLIALMAVIYFSTGIPIIINKIIQSTAYAKELQKQLDGANIKLSANQYGAIAGSITTITILIGVIIGVLIGIFTALPIILIIPLTALILFTLTLLIILLIPKQKAIQRGREITRELPFALRHIAVELKAGIGLYKTLRTIAISGYGTLSEEISKTVTEIEEGTDAVNALTHLGERTKSEGLKMTAVHIARALKIGGNLSSIINELASEISFNLRMEMREFGEKLNFFGVIFIYVAIVMPVFIVVLGAIKTAPLGPGGKSIVNIPLNPPMIALLLLILLPMMLLMTIYYIKTIQPQI